ncbi:pre-rRNA-processing protein TSR2-like [Musa acuminata AAA Group]|uniref:pre-rRNA-processing protein TSR2-like n=1 Tax=Musa acuminata AAA Group TaxID=214697 RepID=UPI0031DD3E83
MDSAGGGPGDEGPHGVLSPQSLSVLGEGISLVFSRWTALQMAVENAWGGKDSRSNSEELASTILSWFSQSKGPLYIDDLENLLEENMEALFNTEIEDGSIEEVAEELMIMHEACLEGNYESIEKLRRSGPVVSAVSQSKRVVDDNSEYESSDEEASEMMVDEPMPHEMVVEKPKQKQMADEDGWSTVTSRKNRGKK